MSEIIPARGKNYGRNSKRNNRKSSTTCVIFNEYLFKMIMHQLRKLNDVGPHYLLKMRLVCKAWSEWILYLDRWVWRYWFNKKKYDARIIVPINFKRSFNARISFNENILRIRKVHQEEKNWVEASKKLTKKKACRWKIHLFSTKVNYKKVGEMKKMKKARRKFLRMQRIKNRTRDKCNKCGNKGQGFSKLCFHCPRSTRKRQHANILKQQKIKTILQPEAQNQ